MKRYINKLKLDPNIARFCINESVHILASNITKLEELNLLVHHRLTKIFKINDFNHMRFCVVLCRA